MNTISQKTADLLLSIDAVSFRFDPPYTFTSGMKSPVYTDNRLVMSYPQVRRHIVDLYIEVIKEKIGLSAVDCISATASAAIPQGAWVADRLGLPMVYVRPSTKKYGKGNRLEGYLEKGWKVVVIEDHISTAESVVGNVETVRELGGEVKYCVATTTYETEKSKAALSGAQVTLLALLTGKQLIARAAEKGILTPTQQKSVEAWLADPIAWGKK